MQTWWRLSLSTFRTRNVFLSCLWSSFWPAVARSFAVSRMSSSLGSSSSSHPRCEPNMLAYAHPIPEGPRCCWLPPLRKRGERSHSQRNRRFFDCLMYRYRFSKNQLGKHESSNDEAVQYAEQYLIQRLNYIDSKRSDHERTSNLAYVQMALTRGCPTFICRRAYSSSLFAQIVLGNM